jgi:hypothetical protein
MRIASDPKPIQNQSKTNSKAFRVRYGLRIQKEKRKFNYPLFLKKILKIKIK